VCFQSPVTGFIVYIYFPHSKRVLHLSNVTQTETKHGVADDHSTKGKPRYLESESIDKSFGTPDNF
jgi:hypothetical protein